MNILRVFSFFAGVFAGVYGLYLAKAGEAETALFLGLFAGALLVLSVVKYNE